MYNVILTQSGVTSKTAIYIKVDANDNSNNNSNSISNFSQEAIIGLSAAGKLTCIIHY